MVGDIRNSGSYRATHCASFTLVFILCRVGRHTCLVDCGCHVLVVCPRAWDHLREVTWERQKEHGVRDYSFLIMWICLDFVEIICIFCSVHVVQIFPEYQFAPNNVKIFRKCMTIFSYSKRYRDNPLRRAVSAILKNTRQKQSSLRSFPIDRGHFRSFSNW